MQLSSTLVLSPKMLTFVLCCVHVMNVFAFETPKSPPALPDGFDCDHDSHCSGGRCEFIYGFDRTNWRGFKMSLKCCSSVPGEANGVGEVSCCGNNMTCKEPPASDPNKYRGKCLCIHKPGSMKHVGCRSYQECSFWDCTKRKGEYKCCSTFTGEHCDETLGVYCCYGRTCNGTNQCETRASGLQDGQECSKDNQCASNKCRFVRISSNEHPLRCCSSEHIGDNCNDAEGLMCCGPSNYCSDNKCRSTTATLRPGGQCDATSQCYSTRNEPLTCQRHVVRVVHWILHTENQVEIEIGVISNGESVQTCCRGKMGDPCPDNPVEEWPYLGRPYGCCEGYTCIMGKCSNPKLLGGDCEHNDNCASMSCKNGHCVRDLNRNPFELDTFPISDD